MSNKHKKIDPTPGYQFLAELRRMTDENDHSRARVSACEWLGNAWEYQHGDRSEGNPFRPIERALRAVLEEHEEAGSLSEELHTVRLYLWNLAVEVVAPSVGLAAAARVLRRAL